MRTGWFREVHVKSEESYRLRLLLTQRRNLKRKFLDIENAIRHSIKTFGLKVGKVSRGQFEARVREKDGSGGTLPSISRCDCLHVLTTKPKAIKQSAPSSPEGSQVQSPSRPPRKSLIVKYI